MRSVQLLFTAAFLLIIASCDKDEPYAGQNPVATGHFSFLLDGAGTNCPYYGGYYYVDSVSFGGWVDNRTYYIRTFCDIAAGQSYALDSTEAELYFKVSNYPTGGEAIFMHSQSGVLTITRMDTVYHSISGTFSATMIDTDGVTHTVTDGLFGFHY